MAAKIKTNFTLREDTIKKMDHLVIVTFRDKGDLIDWLVSEEYARRYSQPQPVLTAVEQPQPALEA